MKKSFIIFLAAALLFAFAACAPQPPAAEQPKDTEAPTAEPIEASTAGPTGSPDAGSTAEAAPEPHSEVLVVYFSATGTTKGVAEKLAALTGGELYEIVPAEPYSAADLNWNDRNSRSTIEQNDKATRPAIGSDALDPAGYSTVYIGFPIWWGEEPRIMDTFVESYDFDGVTLIPFCTSSSSGIGRSGRNLAENAKSGNWLEGKRFGAGVTEAELRAWIDSLK